jgi:hypothetical protein
MGELVAFDLAPKAAGSPGILERPRPPFEPSQRPLGQGWAQHPIHQHRNAIRLARIMWSERNARGDA